MLDGNLYSIKVAENGVHFSETESGLIYELITFTDYLKINDENPIKFNCCEHYGFDKKDSRIVNKYINQVNDDFNFGDRRMIMWRLLDKDESFNPIWQI